MKLLRNLCRAVDTLNSWVGRVVAWVALLLVLVVFVDVCMRYMFNTSFVFIQEMEWHLFGFIFLVGAGYTLLHDGHVRVDIITSRFPPRIQAIITIAGYLLIFMPVYALMTWGAIKFAHTATITNELNSTSWAPRIWPYKIMMALSFLLLVLQGLSTMLKNLKILSGNPEK